MHIEKEFINDNGHNVVLLLSQCAIHAHNTIDILFSRNQIFTKSCLIHAAKLFMEF